MHTTSLQIDLAREGNDIIREASKWSPELAAACEIWKEIDLIMKSRKDISNPYLKEIFLFYFYVAERKKIAIQFYGASSNKKMKSKTNF